MALFTQGFHSKTTPLLSRFLLNSRSTYYSYMSIYLFLSTIYLKNKTSLDIWYTTSTLHKSKQLKLIKDVLFLLAFSFRRIWEKLVGRGGVKCEDRGSVGLGPIFNRLNRWVVQKKKKPKGGGICRAIFVNQKGLLFALHLLLHAVRQRFPSHSILLACSFLLIYCDLLLHVWPIIGYSPKYHIVALQYGIFCK